MKRRIDTTDDIEDSSHYSIEDAKQKAEQDRKLKAAEAKKQKVGIKIKIAINITIVRHFYNFRSEGILCCYVGHLLSYSNALNTSQNT